MIDYAATEDGCSAMVLRQETPDERFTFQAVGKTVSIVLRQGGSAASDQQTTLYGDDPI